MDTKEVFGFSDMEELVWSRMRVLGSENLFVQNLKVLAINSGLTMVIVYAAVSENLQLLAAGCFIVLVHSLKGFFQMRQVRKTYNAYSAIVEKVESVVGGTEGSVGDDRPET